MRMSFAMRSISALLQDPKSELESLFNQARHHPSKDWTGDWLGLPWVSANIVFSVWRQKAKSVMACQGRPINLSRVDIGQAPVASGAIPP